jgi:hypothetical protein
MISGRLATPLNVHRRPISSSLLAFGGQKDNGNGDHPGTTWGGVRANGAAASMSYDRGEAHGVWASLGADQLTGKMWLTGECAGWRGITTSSSMIMPRDHWSE